jgi:flagellar biogenesis protein FliO
MTGTAILPTLVSIVVVLAVLGATLFLLRWASQWRMKSRRRNPKHRVDMVERHPVGRSGAIVVIRHGDTEHVLGVTEHAITPISSSAAPTEPTDEADSTIDLRDDSVESSRRPGLAGRLDALRERTVRH